MWQKKWQISGWADWIPESEIVYTFKRIFGSDNANCVGYYFKVATTKFIVTVNKTETKQTKNCLEF